MDSDTLIRFGTFACLFALFAIVEALVPRRPRAQPRKTRWLTNLAISALNSVSLRLLSFALPALTVGAALDANNNGWGLFNTLSLSPVIETVLAILIFDFAIWFQHLITHKIPILWRLHRVHHADRDIDVTTAIRFHPIEIALSMLLKIGLIYLIGPSALAIILFEILLNGTAMFNHANIALPPALDRILRRILVTPDMHRVHHSTLRKEHDSNYGFALSIWDRALGTYIAQPRDGHDMMTTGLEWQDERPSRLGWSLALPFLRK
ncbi:sterol desaturase family protein [Shimia sp.]|uniref:sterol desaturase family protein n=1 Tax=Shimia sp. TaxID=1954381 RepID=UPI003298EEDD